MIRLLDYLDYRAFLRDWTAWQKQNKRGFSLRAFSGRVGVSGTSFLSAVIGGKKNLGDELRMKLPAALSLEGADEQYFHILVQFNQAKDIEGKNYHFRQLARFRGSRAKAVGEGQWRFYERWYYAAVWNYLGLKKVLHSPAAISAALRPQVTPAQVEEALQVLQELGMLKKTAQGFEPSETHLTTEPEVASLAVKNHILDLNRIAAQQLDVPASERQFNTLMFQVSPKGYDLIKERMRQFQEELRDILDRDAGEDRIYALAMSLFPLSDKSGQ